ncbi:hypothetical protein EG329_004998 [Mollisiaceae sp. DMI_Dod_QoI]|nr:hypothetical protein EG329_004998 [Helotiales sp. DMI_Dod_QoI]
MWNDAIRFGPSANDNGEPFGNQMPPTTTFSSHASQWGDDFSSSDLNNDFFLFDDTYDFGRHSSISMPQPETTFDRSFSNLEINNSIAREPEQ